MDEGLPAWDAASATARPPHLRWPYHANVMKMLEHNRSSIVESPLIAAFIS